MKKELIIPLISLITLGCAGITAMVLGAVFDLEWCKNIAFLLFGTSTSPLHTSFQYIKSGALSSKKDVIAKCMIGGIFGLSLSMFACGGASNVNHDCVIKAGVKCYELTSKCFENDASTDTVTE